MPVFDADAWRRTALAVAAFRHAHGHWPRASTTAPPEERTLGRWLARTRNAFKAGRVGRITASENRAFLDLNVPGWDGSTTPPGGRVRDDRWYDTAAQVVAFRAESNRWPRDRADERDERRLGTWLTNTRHADRRGAAWLTEDRTAWLDTHLTGWRGRARAAHRPRSDEAWHANLDALVAFDAEYGRLPSRSTDADDPEHLRLARWLSNARSADRRGMAWLTEDRRMALDKAMPQWRA